MPKKPIESKCIKKQKTWSTMDVYPWLCVLVAWVGCKDIVTAEQSKLQKITIRVMVISCIGLVWIWIKKKIGARVTPRGSKNRIKSWIEHMAIWFKTKISVRLTATGSKLEFKLVPEQKVVKKSGKNQLKTHGRPIFWGQNRG